MDGMKSYTELLASVGVPGFTRLGTHGDVLAFLLVLFLLRICWFLTFITSKFAKMDFGMDFGTDAGAGCSAVGSAGRDDYFDGRESCR